MKNRNLPLSNILYQKYTNLNYNPQQTEFDWHLAAFVAIIMNMGEKSGGGQTSFKLCCSPQQPTKWIKNPENRQFRRKKTWLIQFFFRMFYSTKDDWTFIFCCFFQTLLEVRDYGGQIKKGTLDWFAVQDAVYQLSLSQRIFL